MGGRRRTSSRRVNYGRIAKTVEERIRFPRWKYSRGYLPRPSVTGGADLYGASFRDATTEQKEARVASGFHGRGLYTGHGKYNFGRSLRSFGRSKWGSALKGAAIGGLTGGPEGAMAGGLAGYTGSGEYVSNNLVSGVGDAGAAAPSMITNADETGDITITHKEYITDIYGPEVTGDASVAPFNVQSYELQPGLSESFPWLSQMAVNYDEYEFVQLLYTFRSTVSDSGNSNAGQVGTIIMATNYKAGAKPFVDKQQMITYAHARSAKITDDMVHGIECAEGKTAGGNYEYIRHGAVPDGEDIKTYDKGVFQFGLANVPSDYENSSIGELWVEYTVRLSKPKLFSQRGSAIEGDTYITDTVNTDNNATGYSYFGVDPSHWLTGQANDLNTTLAFNGTGLGYTLTFPASFVGAVKVQCIITLLQTQETTLLAPIMTASGNIVPLNDIYTTSGAPINNMLVGSSAVAGQDVMCEYHFYVRAPISQVNNTILLPSGPADNVNDDVSSQLMVTRYNSHGLSQDTDRLLFENNLGQVVDPSVSLGP